MFTHAFIIFFVLSFFSNPNIAESNTQHEKEVNLEIEKIISMEKKEVSNFEFQSEPLDISWDDFYYQKEEKNFPVVAESPSYSSLYGHRKDPKTEEESFHHGVDVLAPMGSKILSTHKGKVLFAEKKGDFGKLVKVLCKVDEQLYVIYYAHLQTIKVAEKDFVEAGDVIGSLGDTGRTTGAHLHYEVRERKSNDSVDPIEKGFLPQKIE